MNCLRADYLTAMALMAIVLSGCQQQQANAPIEAQEETEIAPADTPEVEPNGTIIEIQMFTIDPDNPADQHVFKPRLVSAKVGDTIRFIPSEPSHQSSSIATMLPEGARGWEGEVNEELSYVLPKPGIYGYQCIPHYAAGMVGVVIVEGEGKTANLEMAKEAGHPGLGVPEFAVIFAEAEARGLLEEPAEPGAGSD